MSIPLVQNNEKDSINTSIIAIKRNIERINMLLGLSNSEEIDTSEFVKKDDIVDEVTVGNMQSVTSNAVAESLQGSTYTDSDGIVYKKIGNVVSISGYGVTAGTLHNKSIPSEYQSNNNLTFCCYVRGSNKAFLGFLGITNKFYLSFIPSYPADNIQPSDSAVVYFTVTYII